MAIVGVKIQSLLTSNNSLMFKYVMNHGVYIVGRVLS